MLPVQIPQLTGAIQPKPRGRAPSALADKIAKLDGDKVLDVSKITPTGTGTSAIKRPTTTRSTKYGSDTLPIVSSDLDHYLMAIDMLPGGRQQYAVDIQVFQTRLAAGPRSPKGPTSPTILATAPGKIPVLMGLATHPGGPKIVIPTPVVTGLLQPTVPTIPRMTQPIAPTISAPLQPITPTIPVIPGAKIATPPTGMMFNMVKPVVQTPLIVGKVPVGKFPTIPLYNAGAPIIMPTTPFPNGGGDDTNLLNLVQNWNIDDSDDDDEEDEEDYGDEDDE